MKPTQERVVEIAMATYLSIGILLINRTLNVYSLIFSGSCGLLFLTAILPRQKDNQAFCRYDSWGWSKSANKLVTSMFIIIAIGGVPLWEKWIYDYMGREVLVPLVFVRTSLLIGMGVIMGAITYVRSCLKPIHNETMDIEALKLEHNEWSGLTQTAIVFGAIGFIATGFVWLSGFVEDLFPFIPTLELLFFFYLVIGYVLWFLRPLLGRNKEIRDYVNELQRQRN